MKVAVVGAGQWGKNHVRVFHKLGALAWVVDKDPTLLEKARQEYPGIRTASDLQEALADTTVGGVVVATPAKTHFSVAMDALQSGRDVLVEKPMTLSVPEAEELVRQAEELGRVLMVGHLLLYRPSIDKLCELVQSGRIGNVYKVEMRRRKLGKVRRHENVLWSFGPHDVAVLLAMLQREVSRVWAVGSSFLQEKIEDETSMHLSFGEQVKAELHFSWLWPIDERKCIVVGSEGMITYDEIEDSICIYDKKVKSDLNVHNGAMEMLRAEAADALERQNQHFLDCMATRQTPRTSGRQGIEVVRCLTGAMRNIEREVFCEHGVFCS